MYLAADANCNNLAFLFGDTGIGASRKTPSFSIRITQYSCNYENLAPTGCTQYFYGDDEGIVKSFNYDGGQHLANQNQKVCFRREDGNTQLCLGTSTVDDFQVSKGSGNAAADMNAFKTASCCSYGAMGKGESFDCVMIPSASSSKGALVKGSGFCGDAGLATVAMDINGDATMTKSLCTKRQPFSLNFNSDGWESADENTAGNKGFKLYFKQN